MNRDTSVEIIDDDKTQNTLKTLKNLKTVREFKTLFRQEINKNHKFVKNKTMSE